MADITCPVCGHDLALSGWTQSIWDQLRGRPPHRECRAVEDADYGNGMSGSGPCGCRDEAHGVAQNF